jgi:hypothetical protein
MMKYHGSILPLLWKRAICRPYGCRSLRAKNRKDLQARPAKSEGFS